MRTILLLLPILVSTSGQWLQAADQPSSPISEKEALGIVEVLNGGKNGVFIPNANSTDAPAVADAFRQLLAHRNPKDQRNLTFKCYVLVLSVVCMTSFATLHGYGAFHWNMLLGEERFSALRQRVALPQRKWRLELSQNMWRSEQLTHPAEAIFRARILNDDGDETAGALAERRWLDPDAGEPTFRLDETGPIIKMLKKARADQDDVQKRGSSRHAEVSVVLRVRKADFITGSEWLEAAPQPPDPLDFRFRALVDTTQHDITLRCRDGVVTASRQALYYSSVYFRRRLMEPDVGDELHESSPCIIVKQALAFMLTTTFAHPGDMTVDHAEELINISLIYQPIRRNALVTAIERHLFGQLDKAKDNLPLLLQYFLLGYKWRLERLPTACSTLIFMHHQGDYVANYAHATATTPISRTHQELLDQLHAPRNPFRMAPHSKLVELFPYAQPVQVIAQ